MLASQMQSTGSVCDLKCASRGAREIDRTFQLSLKKRRYLKYLFFLSTNYDQHVLPRRFKNATIRASAGDGFAELPPRLAAPAESQEGTTRGQERVSTTVALAAPSSSLFGNRPSILMAKTAVCWPCGSLPAYSLGSGCSSSKYTSTPSALAELLDEISPSPGMRSLGKEEYALWLVRIQLKSQDCRSILLAAWARTCSGPYQSLLEGSHVRELRQLSIPNVT